MQNELQKSILQNAFPLLSASFGHPGHSENRFASGIAVQAEILYWPRQSFSSADPRPRRRTRLTWARVLLWQAGEWPPKAIACQLGVLTYELQPTGMLA